MLSVYVPLLYSAPIAIQPTLREICPHFTAWLTAWVEPSQQFGASLVRNGISKINYLKSPELNTVSGYRSMRSGFNSRRYQIFWEAVGLERGALSLASTTEELLERKSSGSCLENLEYCRRDPSRWQRGTLYPQKLSLISPTSGGRSVGIIRSRTQATEFF
jgi:hypothetical protein